MAENSKNKFRGERREHFRGRAGPGKRVDLSYRRSDGTLTAAGTMEASAVTTNLGIGGTFLLTKTPEGIGTSLEISLQIPHEQEEQILWLHGSVQWVEATATGQGMGVHFESLDVDSLRSLREYLSRLA